MKRKRIIIFTIGGILILSVFLINYLKNKNPVLKTEENNSGMFSYMLETEAGSGNYEMSADNKWPGSGYIYNEQLSKCENGSKLTWNDETKSVTVKANVSDKCYLYFDIEPRDITIATNNVDNTFNPTTPATLNCNGSESYYNQKYQRIEISSIANQYTTCNLTYQIPSSKNYLNTYITSLAGQTQGNGKVVDEQATIIDNSEFNPTTTLSKNNYSNLSNDATYPFTWNSTDKTWTSTNKDDSTASTITFNPNSNGHYQICYVQSSEKNYDYARVYKNNSEILNLKGIGNTEFECHYLGNLSTSDTIKVTYSKDSSSSNGNDNVIFYLQSGTYNGNIEKISTGIRYEGKNPNNYIWFNKELWRIIGVFDSASHGQSGQNLVKIIRADSLGGLAWHKSNTNDWTASSLMNLLNGAYLNAEDGTESGYCYGYSTSVPSNCDYTNTGISATYRYMIVNAKWHLGWYSSTSITAEAFYGYERGTTVYSGRQTEWEGKIGLMYPSDYGYSVLASSCARTTYLGSYNNSICAGESWLYGFGYEWTITPNSSTSYYVFNVSLSGDLYSYTAVSGISARPVLYLDSNVYVMDGSGTASDPYIIGM